MTLFKRLSAFALLLALLTLTQPAEAHGYIVRAIPEDRAVMERAPTRLQYWFSEALEPDFSELNVRDQNGDVIATGGVAENDNTLMSVRLPSDLEDGAYIVELRPAFASDGHVVAESRVFFVGEEIGGVAGQAANNQAVLLEVVWRVLVLSSSMLLFGAFTLYTGVLVPAWGNKTHRAGLLPPRVMKRLNIIVGVALAVAFLGNGLALIQQTMVFFNIGFMQALDPNFWSLVRVGSRFGDVWNWRIFLLGLVGTMYLASLYSRESQPETVRAFWVANAWVMALVLGTFSIISHAAGSLLWPWVGVTVDWLHTLGVGFWVGALPVLTLVLPIALKPYAGETRRAALLAAMRRYSRVAVAGLFVVVTTGIYSSTNWIYSTDEIQTTFGSALLIKVAMVAGLIAIGALHHMALRPERYARFQAVTRHVRDFVPSLRLEVVVVFAVLIGASTLSATPVPVPEFAQREVEAPMEVQTADGMTVVLTLLPGGPGVNTFDTTITRDGERVEGLDVRLRKMHPSEDIRSDWYASEPVEAGLYVTASADIDEAGRWWSLMEITDDTGETHRLAFDWQISDEAAVIESVEPNLANIAALVGVMLAVGWAAYPFAKRGYDRLNLDAFSVSVAATTVVVTAVVMVVGFVVVENTRTDYADTLNPPPEVINSVLPTQASIARGQRFFETECEAWLGNRDFDELINRLPRTRDDELFYAVRDGWRDLPACSEHLSVFQHWDVVNYIRTFEPTTL